MKTIFVDMDNVLCDYDKAYNQALEQYPEVAYPQSQYGFFASLQPIDGAIDAIKTLLLRADIEVFILTAPSIKNPLCYTEKRIWVEKWLGMAMVERLIISPNKGILRGDILIDDHNSGNGQEHFKGRMILFGSEDYPDWRSVINRL